MRKSIFPKSLLLNHNLANSYGILMQFALNDDDGVDDYDSKSFVPLSPTRIW